MELLLQLLAIVGVVVAGLAEAHVWGKWWWTAGLLTSGSAESIVLVIGLYRRRATARIARLLEYISEYALLDRGSYTLTIYRAGRTDGLYRAAYRYSRRAGFERNVDSEVAFPPDLLSTTVGAALRYIDVLCVLHNIPPFTTRAQMVEWHTTKRCLPDKLVAQFSDRAITIRSHGSMAIVPKTGHSVVAVLTIDCQEPDGLRRPDLKGRLSYFAAQLGVALP